MRSVRFLQTQDGVSLAWTRSGTGPPLVKAASWLTHLEHDDASPVWSHFVRFLETHFDYLRYDERGCGMSDRKTGNLTVEAWSDDLDRVVMAADMPKPFVLLAMSQGTGAAVTYAARHPDRVSHLVICGGYARGPYCREDPEGAALYDAVIEMFRTGFGSSNPAYREVLTRRYIQDGDPDSIQWFNELCRRTMTPEIATELLRARGHMDVRDQLARVTCPTLILHAKGDTAVDLAEGRLLAREIPDAELVVLPTANHILQKDEPSWDIFCRSVLGFLGTAETPDQIGLSPRETDILRGICAAKSNKDIARDLGISDKTVRNQITRLFEKLDVTNRQTAILKAQALGFGDA